jgi:multisubunit Na+/H+ antiporter MnhF subunit
MMAGVTAQQVFCVVAIMMTLISFVRTVAYARYIEREGP